MSAETQELLQLVPGSIKKATVGISSGDLWKVPLDRIRILPEYNVRDKNDAYWAQVNMIADSIVANGYDESSTLTGFVYEDGGEHFLGLTDGHHRLDAVAIANKKGCEITTLPMVAKARGTSMEDITIGLYTKNSGSPLTPLELARVCKRLVGYSMEVKEIATRLGLTKQYVDSLLDLLAAPKVLRDMVSSGQVAATLAIDTLKKHGKDAGKVLKQGLGAAKAAGRPLKEGETIRVTGKHVKAAVSAKATATKGKSALKGKKVAVTPPPVVTTTSTGISDTENLLELGMTWLEQHGIGNPDHECVQMLAFLAAVDVTALAPRLAALEATDTSDDL